MDETEIKQSPNLASTTTPLSQEPVIVPQPRKSRKKIIFAIILLILLLVGFGIIAFLFIPKRQKESLEKKQSQAQPSLFKAHTTNPQPTQKITKITPTPPPLSETDMQTFIEGQNYFGFDLFHVVSGSTSNIVFSPISLALSLSMMYQGAEGNTLSQMQSVMHYNSLSKTQINSGAQSLLTEILRPRSFEHGGYFTLKLANSMWIRSDRHVNSSFETTLQQSYFAQLFSEDFTNPNTADKINAWVSDKTENKIGNIINAIQVKNADPFILANAVYFDAAWQDKFDKEKTSLRSFTPYGGKTHKVNTMNIDTTMGYYENSDFQSVELRYSGGASMYIFLPKKNLPDFLSNFTYKNFKSWEENEYNAADVKLYLPKFKFEYEPKITDTLKSLGMKDAFERNSADFSLIAPDIYIGDIIHHAMIDVNEDGTTAAAATVVLPLLGGGGDPQLKSYTVNINKSFVYVITQNATNEILFMGTVLDP